MAPTTRRVRASIASAGYALLLGATLVIGPGAGAEQPPGNTVNPPSLEPWRHRDERGLTALQPERRRTPTGFLYPYPPEPLEYKPFGSSLFYRGSIGLGVLWDGGDEDETRFERYADWDDGTFLSVLSLELLDSGDGDYLELFGGAIGRDDEFFRLEAGRAGWLRLRGSFSRTPHRYANDATVLFSGVGTESLTLSGPPGSIDLAGEVAASGDSRLEIRRDSTRASASWRVRPGLNLVARYGFEKREGERPFGGAFSFPQVTGVAGAVVETAAPVRDRWHDISAGVEYGGKLLQANLFYTGSLYSDDRDRLAFDNPFDLGGGVTLRRGRFAGPPDNEAHRISGVLALALPAHSRLKTTISWQTMRQDDDLLPPTVNSVTVAGIDLSDWNGVTALSDRDADAQIDTLLVDATLRVQPWRALRIRGRYRYYRQDNDTSYVAFNPGTGEYGYIVEDGGNPSLFGAAFSGVFQPGVPGNDFPVRNTPYELTRQNYELSLSYRVDPTTAFELTYKGESVDREFRERDDTREDRVRASLSTRRTWATFRLSYEYGTRDVSSYAPSYRRPFSFSGLPGFVPRQLEPPGLAQLERPALSDRRQQIGRARMNLMLGDSADLTLIAGYRSDDYSSDYGPRSDRRVNVNLDWSYQPSPRATFNVFGSFERTKGKLSTIRGVAGSTDPNAGGPAFPLSNAWSAESDAYTVAFGAGLSLQLTPRVSLRSDYNFVRSSEELSYEFATPGALAIPTIAPGTRFPDLQNREQILETTLRWSFREDLALRVYHRYDDWTIDDWSQRTLVALNGNRLFFAHRDQDFKASVYGIVLEARF